MRYLTKNVLYKTTMSEDKSVIIEDKDIFVKLVGRKGCGHERGFLFVNEELLKEVYRPYDINEVACEIPVRDDLLSIENNEFGYTHWYPHEEHPNYLCREVRFEPDKITNSVKSSVIDYIKEVKFTIEKAVMTFDEHIFYLSDENENQ